MSCPITSSKEWKDFEKKAGSEFDAHALFFANNFEIPDTIDFEKAKSVDFLTVNSFTKYNKERSKIQFGINETIDKYKSSENKELVERLTGLLEQLEEANIKESIDIILNTGNNLSSSIISKINSLEDITALDLTSYKSYMSAFANVKDLKDYILSVQNNPETLAKIDNLIKKVEDFNSLYTFKAKELAIEELSARSTFIRAKEKFLAEKEFKKNTPRAMFFGTNKEYQDLVEAYIKQHIEKNEEEITRKTKAYVREQLTRVPQDIGSITSMLVDPRGVNDMAIQLIVQMLDEADYKIDKEFSEARNSMIAALEEYEKNGNTDRDQKKKYKGIIEIVDGKETNYYVGVVFNSVMNEWKKLAYRQKDLLIPDNIKEKELQEFKDKYINPKYHGEDIIEFKKEKGHPLELFGKKEIKNPQWSALKKDPVKFKMWEALRNFNKASDKLVGRGKLGYKIPGVVVEGAESIYNNGLKEAAKQKIKDSFQKNQNDTDLGETETIEGVTVISGNRFKVNLPYRNSVKIEDQSFDLVGMALMNRYASLNYKEKWDLQATAEMIKNVVGEREFKVTKNNNILVKSIRSATKSLLGVDEDEIQELIEKGDKSNSYKLLNSIIEDRIYGIKTVDAGIVPIIGIDGNKLTNAVLKWSSGTLLIGNVAAAGSNVIQGKVMNFLASITGKDLTRKALRQGEATYWSDMAGWTADIGARNLTSKTNLLLERTVGGDYVKKFFGSDFVDNSKAERLLSTKTLHGMNSSVEHYIQSTLMYGVLNSFMIDGKPAIEYYKVENGVLVYTGESKFPEAKLRSKMKAVIANAHGNYDSNNQAMIQRYWYGKLAMFLRKWIVRGVKRRWSGIGTSDKPLYWYIENEPHMVNFYEESGDFEEGTYTSAIRFIRQNISNIKQLQFSLMTTNWNQLSEMEKRNIQGAVTELAIMVGALLASMLTMGLAEDDEDENSVAWASTYFLRRLYGELAFYNPLNVNESLRILSSPSASMSMIELVGKGMSQVGEDLFSLEIEEDSKGNSKSWIIAKKMFNPKFKNIDELSFEDKTNFVISK